MCCAVLCFTCVRLCAWSLCLSVCLLKYIEEFDCEEEVEGRPAETPAVHTTGEVRHPLHTQTLT